jgi:hypothetical protein
LAPDVLTQLKPSERAEIVSFVRKQYQKCKDTRHKQEAQWYVNLAFYFGKQNVSLSYSRTAGFRLNTPQAPYWRARPVINKIKPIIRRELAKLLSTEPTAYVVPASSEDQDLFAAQAGQNIWESLYDKHKLHKIIRSAAFWTSITGNSFIKAYWDPTAIDPDNPTVLGDLAYYAINPFSIFVPSLTVEDIEKQPYVIEAQMRDLEWAQLNWGDKVTEPIQASGRSDAIMDSGFLKLIGAEDPPLESVEVVEMWIKPGQFKLFPEGGMVTLVNDQLVQYIKGHPYSHNKYPYAHLGLIDTGGFYRDCVINDLISPQREFNRTRGQIQEAKNRMAKPQLLAAKGSIDASKITTEPGQVIFYRIGLPPPSPLPLQPLPQYVIDETQRIKEDMDDISGQHDVSRGTVPPGVSAATAISYLQEQDDTMLSSTVREIETAAEKIAKISLALVVQFWDTPRMVKVTGTDGSFDAKVFEGAQLNGNTDIRVEKDSALPTSRSAKQAFLMDLMKMGFISSDRGLELMEVGGLNKLYDQIQVDRRQAQRENLRIQGMPMEVIEQYGMAIQIYEQAVASGAQNIPPVPPPVPVNDWDNHAVHIEVHNNFRKSQTFEALPDIIKAAFQDHVSMHDQALMMQQMAAGMMPMEPGQGNMETEQAPPAGGQPLEGM